MLSFRNEPATCGSGSAKRVRLLPPTFLPSFFLLAVSALPLHHEELLWAGSPSTE